jgi:hypothetical protein
MQITIFIITLFVFLLAFAALTFGMQFRRKHGECSCKASRKVMQMAAEIEKQKKQPYRPEKVDTKDLPIVDAK